MQIMKLYDAVHAVLKENSQARNSNEYLYYFTIKKLGHTMDVSAIELLRCMHDKEYPKFEAVTRARRKVQEDYPALAGNKEERLEIAKNVQKDLGYNKD